MSPILCADLGTTHWKLDLVHEPDAAEPMYRQPSLTSLLDGTGTAPLSFARSIEVLAAEIREILAATRVGAIVLTGVREGLALLNEAGGLVWASGNSDPSLWRGASLGATRLRPVTLQGYLAYLLTGQARRSSAEARGHAFELRRVARLTGARIPAGVVIRPDEPGIVAGADRPLFLAGPDETMFVHGAGEMTRGDAVLNTGTYWNLARPQRRERPLCAAGRAVAATAPYADYTVVVGYRWGELLWHFVNNPGERFPRPLPEGAAGELCRTADARLDATAVAAIMQRDLRRAAACLHAEGYERDTSIAVLVTGGGVRLGESTLRRFLPPEWTVSFAAGDATLRGMVRLARSAGFA
jgi:hypothetical protein